MLKPIRIGILIQSAIATLLMFVWLFITRYFKVTGDYDTDVSNILEMLTTSSAYFFVVAFWIFYLFFSVIGIKQIQIFVYNYRYLIGFIILLLVVIFEISGSSLGMWGYYLNNVDKDRVLLGVNRSIRSDEWAVRIPFTISQFSNQFKYFSHIIRGTKTDIYLLDSLPVLDIIPLFLKPANLGFLFLGFNKGLSFFWIFRFLLLWFSMFELGMLIGNKNKWISCFLATMVSFSPLLQWWFSAGGLVEMLSMGSLFLILLHQYLKTKSYLKRIFLILSMSWCGNVYIVTFYPAWQIPIAYFYLSLLIYIICTNLKTFYFDIKKDTLLVLLFLFLICTGSGYVLFKSWDTIQMVLQTVYPGKRTVLGGGGANFLFDYVFSIFYPLIDINNERAMNVVYDLFPFSSVVALYVWYKTHDKLLLSLLLVDAFFLFYICFPLPELIAKLTLLTFSTPSRLLGIFGILNLLILSRALVFFPFLGRLNKKIVVSAYASVSIVAISWINIRDYIHALIHEASKGLMYLLIVVATLILFVFISSFLVFRSKVLFFITTIVSFLSGVLVNPIRVGSTVVSDSKIIHEIRTVQKQHGGIWMVDILKGESIIPYDNLPLLAGARTINSTNIYPNLKLWRGIDSGKLDDEVYNRFAHIGIHLTSEGHEDIFTVITPDTFVLDLPVDKLKIMKVDNVLSLRDVSSLSNQDIHFDLITKVDRFYIYRVEYPS